MITSIKETKETKESRNSKNDSDAQIQRQLALLIQQKMNALLIVGATRTGKTTLLSKIANKLLQDKGKQTLFLSCQSISDILYPKTSSGSAARQQQSDQNGGQSAIVNYNRWIIGADCLCIDQLENCKIQHLQGLDELCRRLRRSYKRPFGGMICLFAGDFSRALPGLGKPPFIFDLPVWKELFGTLNNTCSLRGIPHTPLVRGCTPLGSLAPSTVPGVQQQQQPYFNKAEFVRENLTSKLWYNGLLHRIQSSCVTELDKFALKSRLVTETIQLPEDVIHVYPKNDQVDTTNLQIFNLKNKMEQDLKAELDMDMDMDVKIETKTTEIPDADLAANTFTKTCTKLDKIREKDKNSLMCQITVRSCPYGASVVIVEEKNKDKEILQKQPSAIFKIGTRVCLMISYPIVTKTQVGDKQTQTFDCIPFGSLGRVVSISHDTDRDMRYPVVQFDSEIIQIIKPMTWTFQHSKMGKMEVTGTPLKMAFAVTSAFMQMYRPIVSNIVTVIDSSCYCAGQAYSCLASVDTLGQVYLRSFDEAFLKVTRGIKGTSIPF